MSQRGSSSLQLPRLGAPFTSARPQQQQMTAQATHIQMPQKTQGMRQQPQVSEKTNKTLQDLNAMLTNNAQHQR